MKPQEKSNFLKNGKMVISVKNPKLFYISDDETDFTVGIVSRNLATTSNFVDFRDSQNFHVFRENERNVGHFTHFEWLTVCHMSGA